MKLPPPQRLILYALGQFYLSLNQPLTQKPLQVQTSKITFIELLKQSTILTKQPRAIYKNLETLQQQKLITYNNHTIQFTPRGLQEFKKITLELLQMHMLEQFFAQHKPKRKLQTMLKE